MRGPLLVVAIGDEAVHNRLVSGLSARGYRVQGPRLDVHPAITSPGTAADLVIVGATSTGFTESAAALVARIRGANSVTPILVFTRHSAEREAAELLEAGASAYLEESVSIEHLDVTIRLALQRSPLRQPSGQVAPARSLLGDSAAMRDIRSSVVRLAGVDSNVLITGETGTGKELVAEALHCGSPRRRQTFVRVNCAAVPDTLLESELFGHERGAFTGAESRREGLVTMAQNGTIFFDEVGDMSPLGQAKILRAIETKEIRRLGAKGGMSIDVRVVAATNRDVERMVADGQLRSDLYFRLNVARLHLPPLRDRKDDIPLLSDHYIAEFNRRMSGRVTGVTPGVGDSFARYHWPGNVRELRNVIECAFLRAREGPLAYEHLPEHFVRTLSAVKPAVNERDLLISILEATNWNKSKAASELQLSRMTLYRRMAKHHIHPSYPGLSHRQIRRA